MLNGRAVSSACGLFSWILAVCALFSAKWIWASWLLKDSVSFEPDVVSLHTSPIWISLYEESSAFGNTVISNSMRLTMGGVGDEACSASLPVISSVPVDAYKSFGAYGFCSGEEGHFQTPASASAVIALGSVAIICLSGSLFVTCLTASKPSIGTKKFSAVLYLISAALLIAQFSVALSWDYYSALRSGQAGILVQNSTANVSDGVNPYVLIVSQDQFGVGIGFAASVLAAIVAILAAFFRCCRSDEEETFQGDDDDLTASSDINNIKSGIIQV